MSALPNTTIAFATTLFSILILLSACARNPEISPPPPTTSDSQPALSTKHTTDEVSATVHSRANSQPQTSDLTTDAWQRLRDGYRLKKHDNSYIDNAIEWFNTNASVIRKGSARATPFLYFILEEIESRDLPSELALIPLLESGYRVHAKSPYGALGLWQFMPATGRQFGLYQSEYLERRRDFVLATRAALDYLSDLNLRFEGDWLLAIAAYNAGPGTIMKARRDRGETYWDIIDKLPAETQTYVPKLLAASRIIQSPSEHETQLKFIANEPYFETVKVAGPVDFKTLESLANWDQKMFMRLNGALMSSYFGLSQEIVIRVPLGYATQVTNHLASVEAPPVDSSTSYVVQRGDTLASLALRFNVSVSALKSRNGLHGHYIRAGKRLSIPNADIHAEQPKVATKSNQRRYIVKPGDSFWTLGRRYGLSARKIATSNDLAINKTLYPGQLLHIPVTTTNSNPSVAFNYIVERGDSLWSIAKRFGIALDDLKRWNPIIKSNSIKPGQKLLVQAP